MYLGGVRALPVHVPAQGVPEDSARGDCAGRRGEGLQGASQVGGAVDDVDGLAAGGEIVELGEAMADGLDHTGGGRGQLGGVAGRAGSAEAGDPVHSMRSWLGIVIMRLASPM